MLKIISGGQTGADQGGLEAGKELSLTTGGVAPKGWLTEEGPKQELLSGFGLTECVLTGYPARTELNIMESDGTVIFGDIMETGSSLTLKLCRKLEKPYLVNPKISEFQEFILAWPIKILNVAGNRESKYPGIQERVKNFLVNALREISELHSEDICPNCGTNWKVIKDRFETSSKAEKLLVRAAVLMNHCSFCQAQLKELLKKEDK